MKAIGLTKGGWRNWGLTGGSYVISLWVTKPLITGGEEWIPNVLAHELTAAFLVLLWCAIWAAERFR